MAEKLDPRQAILMFLVWLFLSLLLVCPALADQAQIPKGQSSFWNALGVISTFLAIVVALTIAVFGESLKAWWSAPRLRIEFEERPPDCHITRTRDGTPVYYFRFRVVNNGRSAARLCEAIVESLAYFRPDDQSYEVEENFSHINLNWSSTFADPQLAQLRIFRTINPRRQIHCDLGHIPAPRSPEQTRPDWRGCTWFRTDDLDVVKFLFDYAVSPFSQIAYLRPGRYRIGIAVYAENAETDRKELEISWSGTWADTEEQMFREFRISEAS